LILVPLVLAVSVIAALKMSRGLRGAQLAVGPLPRVGAVPLPTSPPGRGRALGLFLVLVGGVLATAGAAVLLSVLLATGKGVGGERDALVELLVAGLLVGVLPAVGGLMLFRGGTRRLNRAGA